MDPLGDSAARIDLAPGRGELRLAADGLHHPRSTGLGGRCFSPWPSITDVAVGPLGLRLATRHGVFFLRRTAFVERGGPEALFHAVLEAIAARPGGAAQLERMAELGRRARRPPRLRASRAAALLCVLAYAFQGLVSPHVELAGAFSAPLVALGEIWRLATANVLHGGLFHLGVNTLGLLVIGGLAERCLGAAATLLVMGLSALGAMLGSWLAGYVWALGASGVVAGLVGALLWLEFHCPERLPGAWRLPRRVFLVALVGESLLLLGFPGVAHAAHAGGFLAGAGVAALTGPGPQAPARRPALLGANAVLGVLLVACLGHAAALALTRDPALLEARAEALLATEDVPALLLNNEAWLIAIAEDPHPRELDAALALAERAVAETDASDPNVLDTLAEVHFAAGRPEAAIRTIDRAIALAPAEPYFREQRRRYTGERAADDRPDPPSPFGPPAAPPAPEEPPGLRV